MLPKLGILAGGGLLPRKLADHCELTGREYFIVALESYAEASSFVGLPHTWVRMGSAGKIIRYFKEERVQHIVMVGPVQRPSILTVIPDWRGIKFFLRAGRKAFGGDNSLLSAIATELEIEGFKVVGVDSLLEGLLAPLGPFGNIAPDKETLDVIQRGIKFSHDLGKRDLGQAVVMLGENLLAVEDANGTDDLIKRSSGALSESDSPILVKTKKPGQDRRIDLPTVGSETVKLAAKHGFSGIAVGAGQTVVIDKTEVIKTADDEGLFVVGVESNYDKGGSNNNKIKRIVVIAGEKSGDVIGGRLIAAIKIISPQPIEFLGIGGSDMNKQGIKSLFPMSELSHMGILEILPHLPNLIKRIKQTISFIESVKPDAVVTIDSPDFTLRVLRGLRETDSLLIHYVAPSVWAWKAGRARKMSRYLDLILTLLHFEPHYFESVGLRSTFVGHPVLESGIREGNAQRFLREHGVESESRLVCILPGSRIGEVKTLLPVIGQVLDNINNKVANLEFVIPLTENVENFVKETVEPWPYKFHFTSTDKAKHDAIVASDVALAASGTVCLELAMAGVPHVTIYKMSHLTNLMAKLFVKLKHVNLINILLDQEIVPEFLLGNCRSELITPSLITALTDNEFKDKQRSSFVSVVKLLESSTMPPSRGAAEAVLKAISQRYQV